MTCPGPLLAYDAGDPELSGLKHALLFKKVPCSAHKKLRYNFGASTKPAVLQVRVLQIGDRPTKLAQAVAELGRIDKTIHALTYIDDEAKRRRILNQLNKGEDRHKLARAVFHGKQGELRQRYCEGQEDQLGALGLVVNMIVLWNTLYINAALEQLVREGHHVTPEDVARLSPLVFEHINLLGRYAFSVPEAVTRGELRPLRNPAEVLEEVA